MQVLSWTCLYCSPERSRAMTYRRLNSFDKEAFHLGLILHLSTAEHLRPVCIGAPICEDTWALGEQVNV